MRPQRGRFERPFLEGHMTDATGIPTSRPKTVLTDIAPVSWEHPADRAALQALRAVPGFDQAVKSNQKIVGVGVLDSQRGTNATCDWLELLQMKGLN